MAQMRKVGTTATTISNDGEFNVLTFHSTNVVKWNEKKIVLNSGGWMTNTTKARMNQCSNQFNLGYSVRQKNFQWFVDFNNKTLLFNNNMELLR